MLTDLALLAFTRAVFIMNFSNLKIVFHLNGLIARVGCLLSSNFVLASSAIEIQFHDSFLLHIGTQVNRIKCHLHPDPSYRDAAQECEYYDFDHGTSPGNSDGISSFRCSKLNNLKCNCHACMLFCQMRMLRPKHKKLVVRLDVFPNDIAQKRYDPFGHCHIGFYDQF